MTEVAASADFTKIRYAQCWEDADVLVDALNVKPGGHYLSIASAGENSFSLLGRGAGRVVTVDLNPAQIACVELRRAAYACLQHGELLELIGSRPCADRWSLFERCQDQLPKDVANFWSSQPELVKDGIGAAGKFERYFKTFREKAMPLVHARRKVDSLFAPRTIDERRDFYQKKWNTLRWRWLFKLFFSRFVMGRLGRDPQFFKYVEGSVAERILQRTRHALTELDPSQNPYLHWILNGNHGEALPHALREENFEIIRANLHRLEVVCGSIEQVLQSDPLAKFDGFNLSDIFEYMSEDSMERLYGLLLAAANPQARLVYWNMLAPRKVPQCFAGLVHPREEEAADLLNKDKAFFYSALRIEEVTC